MSKLKDLIFGKPVTATKKDRDEKVDSTQSLIPVSDIRNGIIVTNDGRYIKLLEILPVNFYLKSPIDQENIIYYFTSYLKIAPDNLQMRVITQKADIKAYSDRMNTFYEEEENALCREMIQDNISEVNYLADSEAVTRRFFLIFQYEPQMKARGNTVKAIAERLLEEANTARRYLDMCGLEALDITYEDNYLLELLYSSFNKKTSRTVKLPAGVFDMITGIHGVYEEMEEKEPLQN